MGTFLGIIIGFVFAAGLLALIDLISKDNGRGYQPNKPLNGSPPQQGELHTETT